VTVVVVGHSVREELEGCLASVDRHAGIPTKTVYVDNASRDDTVRWIRREHPGVTLIQLDRNAWGKGRNAALARTETPYTLFLDSDARLTPGALPSMVSALETNSEWGMLCPRLVYPDGSPQLSCRRFPPRLLPLLRRPPLARWLEDSRWVSEHLMREVDPAQRRFVLYAISACLLFRTATAKMVGPLDFPVGEDIDWGIRWWDAGAEVVYYPDATVIHGYRRASTRPLSWAAVRHLSAFARVQWRYRRRRRELVKFGRELDLRSRTLPKLRPRRPTSTPL
jgi:GT2 family glycosyltransferase